MRIMEETIKKIGVLDERAISAARARQDILTKPAGSLGTLEDISTKVAGITGNAMPKMKDKVIITMAGDHGVTDDGVSAYPKEVTAQMVYNFLNDGAAINVLARHVGARVVIVDMGAGLPRVGNLIDLDVRHAAQLPKRDAVFATHYGEPV